MPQRKQLDKKTGPSRDTRSIEEDLAQPIEGKRN